MEHLGVMSCFIEIGMRVRRGTSLTSMLGFRSFIYIFCYKLFRPQLFSIHMHALLCGHQCLEKSSKVMWKPPSVSTSNIWLGVALHCYKSNTSFSIEYLALGPLVHSFFESTPKAYHNIIEGRGLSTRTLPLAASNERSTTPHRLVQRQPLQTKQHTTRKRLSKTKETKPRLDRS
jgi:hypothetical protein